MYILLADEPAFKMASSSCACANSLALTTCLRDAMAPELLCSISDTGPPGRCGEPSRLECKRSLTIFATACAHSPRMPALPPLRCSHWLWALEPTRQFLAS